MLTKLILILIALLLIGLLCILAGFIASYLHDKNDSTLKSNKCYKVSVVNRLAKLCTPVSYLAMAVGCLGLGLLGTLLLFKGMYAPGICGFFIAAGSAFFGYHSILAIILYFQYAKFEHGRTIRFDIDKKLIHYSNERETEDKSLAEEDVEFVEIHQRSSVNRRKPTAEFEFVKFIDKSGCEFIITSLQTNVLNLADFFDTRKLKFVNNRVNWIK